MSRKKATEAVVLFHFTGAICVCDLASPAQELHSPKIMNTKPFGVIGSYTWPNELEESAAIPHFSAAK